MSDDSHVIHNQVGNLGRPARVTPNDQGALQLSRLLGSGRHGMVFLAVRDHDGARAPVAVKVPSTPDGLENERSALHLFSHRNIVKLHEGPLSNGALVLEYCDRGTLADKLREETLTVAELASLLTDLLSALEEIHGHGWIHGDISPSNIGLRSTGGPAFLDFATARPSDGSDVVEGTAEFAGPLRQADPRLDIRSLAATALRALGHPDRWDHKKRQTHEQLTELVSKCDADETVEFTDLSHIVSSMNHTISAGVARRDLLGGGSDVTPTRAFGPRPTGEETTATKQSPMRSNRRVLLVAVVFLAALIPAIEFSGVPDQRNQKPKLESAASLTIDHTADQTLDVASATWNADDGVVTIVGGEGELTHFAAGKTGDMAAIADWSCDGVATLGVFRPSTGNWFEFDSWNETALASPAPLLGGTSLWVSTDDQGCAVAVLR